MPTQRSSIHARSRLAGLAVAAGLALTPALAQAADAPLRAIGFDEAGAATTSHTPVAVSFDGREVLSNTFDTRAYVRDVAAGTTRPLSLGGRAAGASLDLRRVLISTAEAASPRDTDDDADLYVLDRATGAKTLVSAAPGTGELPGPATPWDALELSRGLISGDGNTVLFRSSQYDYAPDFSTQPIERHVQWRFDLAANTLTPVAETSSDTALVMRSTDNAGRVAVNSAGIYVGTRRIALPEAARNADGHVSPDGTTVVFKTASNAPLLLVDTATGTQSTAPVPSWLITQGYELRGAGNNGAGALLGASLTRATGPRFAFGFLNKAGALSQVGGDIQVTRDTTVGPISQNLAFAASNLHLAQLGSMPLPGVEPPAPGGTPAAFDYLTFRDVECTAGIFSKTWSRAWVELTAQAVGSDLRRPTRADILVTQTTTKKVINAFTLAPGKTRELTVGRTGGFTISARVTLSDGTRIDGTNVVPLHEPFSCSLVL